MSKIHEQIKTKSDELSQIVLKGQENGGLSKEQKDNFNTIESDIKSLQEDLAIFEKASKIQEELNTSNEIIPAPQKEYTDVNIHNVKRARGIHLPIRTTQTLNTPPLLINKN